DGHEGESLDIDSTDRETSLRVAHKRPLGATILEAGVDYRTKKRDVSHTYFEFELDNQGDDILYEADGVINSLIKEDRLDPYLMLSGQAGRIDWETGLRYETTKADTGSDAGNVSSDYAALLPSLHLKWGLGEDSRITASLARSIRRPSFNHLVPAVLEGEFGDNDFIGKPTLEPETAWGLDLGFERRLGRRGVAGVNFFYRDVQDLIEAVNTGDFSGDAEDDISDYIEDNGVTRDEAIAALDPDTFVYSMDNVGEGKVWG